MPSIYSAKSRVMKNNPVWRKISETQVPTGTDQARKMNKKLPESLVLLNEVAKGYPFCIMYHTKEHDPL